MKRKRPSVEKAKEPIRAAKAMCACRQQLLRDVGPQARSPLGKQNEGLQTAGCE